MATQNDQPATKLVQITNIAPQVTKDQMLTLFSFLGKIEDIRLYPTVRNVFVPVPSRICYVKFSDAVSVGVARHMTDTVFIDRALIVTPYFSPTNEIPDECVALETLEKAMVAQLGYKRLPPHVTNKIGGVLPNLVTSTHDPVLAQNNLPLYPNLPIKYSYNQIEEIRRTLLIGNLHPLVTAQQILDAFAEVGDVEYIRFGVKGSRPYVNYALIEFSDQTSIIGGLKLNGVELGGYPITVGHSTVNIEKPQTKSNEAAMMEIEAAMKAALRGDDSVIGISSKDDRRGRSLSRSRKPRQKSQSRSHWESRMRFKSRKHSSSRSRKQSRAKDHKARSWDRKHCGTWSRSKSRDRSCEKCRARSRPKQTHKSESSKHPEKRSKSPCVCGSKTSHSRSRKNSGSPPRRKYRSVSYERSPSPRRHARSSRRHSRCRRRKSCTAVSRRRRSSSCKRGHTPSESRSSSPFLPPIATKASPRVPYFALNKGKVRRRRSSSRTPSQSRSSSPFRVPFTTEASQRVPFFTLNKGKGKEEASSRRHML